MAQKKTSKKAAKTTAKTTAEPQPRSQFGDVARMQAETLEKRLNELMRLELVGRFAPQIEKAVERLCKIADSYDKAETKLAGKSERERKAAERKATKLAKLLAKQEALQAQIDALGDEAE